MNYFCFFVDILLDVVFAVAAVDVVLAAVPVPLDAPAKTPRRGILLPERKSGVYMLHFDHPPPHLPPPKVEI